jgi:hypothetical protein
MGSRFSSGNNIQTLERLMGNGVPRPIGRQIGIAPPGVLSVTLGDTVKITFKVDYMGPALTGAKIHVAFGIDGAFGFNEDGNKLQEISIAFSQETTVKTYTFYANVYIGGSTGIFDLYAKIMGVPGPDIFTPTYNDVLNVGGEPTFSNFVISDYSKI